jgi:gliding motility-associated-like protein
MLDCNFVFLQNRASQVLSLMLLLYLVSINQAYATHVRAGEIIAIRDTTGGNAGVFRYRFIFTMYRDTCPTCVAAGPATLFFGYGSPPVNSGAQEPTRRELIGNETERVTYEFTHTYPAAGIYRVYVTVDNRNRDVLNMLNSVNTPFHVETTIFINNAVGINNTPVLRIPPVDLARVGQRFIHNPDAFDIDGDSLAYRLVIPKRAVGQEVNGYRDPQLVQSGLNETGTGPATFSINQRGDLIWDAPTRPGIYNVAFIVEEWRNGVKIGEVTRDMQIIVRDNINRRPLLEIPNDTCIVAGSPLPGFVRATDPDGNRIRLSASSGLFQNNFPAPRARFIVPAPIQSSPATGNFFWQTECVHVREQPYQVVFRAEDLPTPDTSRKLVDIRTWQIRVVGPRPTGLTATPEGSAMRLSWNSYSCRNATEMIIWRRTGCGDLPDEPCQTGVNPASGYVAIGRVPIGTTTFVDNNNGRGLESGVSYSYVISAGFAPPAGGESLASEAVCTALALDVPFITKVSVERTDAAQGEILVHWMQPRELDLAAYPGPYRYELYRATGLSGSNFSLVRSRTIADFASATVNDTTIRDIGLNTLGEAYNYMVLFYFRSSQLKDSSATASSVRLTVTPGVNMIDLSWQANVPWNNTGTTHKVYRENRRRPGSFDLIAEVAVGAESSFRYSDRGGNGIVLDEDSTYCYYVETYGSYGNPKILSPLINKSQIACAAPLDTLKPCPPLLSIDAIDCGSLQPKSFCSVSSFSNKLTWSYPGTVSGPCDEDIVAYRLYYKRYEEDKEFSLIATISTPQPPAMFYEHAGMSSFAGCYYVTAVDEDGQESVPSNIVCKDNCPYYELPNVFTPNGDSKNDEFRPFDCPRFVQSVEFTVYNRWGRPMFETNNVQINWDGRIGQGEGAADSQVSNGVYYYLAKVRFARLRRSDELVQIKGWIQLLK